jgi:hypothetical protein
VNRPQEHNLDVTASADRIIDMGPEGGNKGGRVIFEGTPRALLSAKGSLGSAARDERARTGCTQGRGDKTAIELCLAGVRDWGGGLRRFFVRLPDDK